MEHDDDEDEWRVNRAAIAAAVLRDRSANIFAHNKVILDCVLGVAELMTERSFKRFCASHAVSQTAPEVLLQP
jgi:hypothetical protein